MKISPKTLAVVSAGVCLKVYLTTYYKPYVVGYKLAKRFLKK